MKKGDKVHLKGREEVTGVIEAERSDNIWGIDYFRYQVRYDDTDLVPPIDWHEETDLVLIEDLPGGNTEQTEPKCECGVDSVMVNGIHSDWCQLYKE